MPCASPRQPSIQPLATTHLFSISLFCILPELHFLRRLLPTSIWPLLKTFSGSNLGTAHYGVTYLVPFRAKFSICPQSDFSPCHRNCSCQTHQWFPCCLTQISPLWSPFSLCYVSPWWLIPSLLLLVSTCVPEAPRGHLPARLVLNISSF